MPAACFQFGPAHSFFFFCGGRYRTLNVSDTFIRYVLQSENLPGKQMSMPTCIALGPTHGEYYAMYTTVENSDRYTYDFQNSHPKLMDWLNQRSKVVGTHIAIGPYRTYYACVPLPTSGGIKYSSNIPSTLKDHLERETKSNPNRKFTSQVSLGHGGSWWIQWPNGDITWDFEGHYDELDKILHSLPEKSVSYLALNPWGAGQYFLLLEDGSVYFSLPAEWAQDVEREVALWQNRFKTLTSGSVKGGKPNSSTRVSGSGLVVLHGGPREASRETEDEDRDRQDLPPPYEGNKN